MSSLADAPNLVGFFSYSREDDEDSGGKLSKLKSAFKRNCAANSVAPRQISDYQDKQSRTASCGKTKSSRPSKSTCRDTLGCS
jgi:hypothetical protein